MRSRAFTPVALLAAALAMSTCGGEEGARTPTTVPTPPDASPAVATPSTRVQPRPTEVQVTYVADGNIWTAGASGDLRRLADATPCPGLIRLQWSPDGVHLACYSSDTRRLIVWDGSGVVTAAFDITSSGSFVMGWAPNGAALAYATDVETGIVTPDGTRVYLPDAEVSYALTAAIDLSWPIWSPDGSRLAFWDAANQRAAAYSVSDQATNPLPVPGRPMAWVTAEALLIAEGYVAPQQVEFPRHEMNLARLDGRTTERRPELDRGRQFWLTDDRRTAAYVTPELQLALLEIESGTARLIAGSSINYPSEGIPPDHVRFADDGSSVYWLDADLPRVSLNSADVSTTTLTKLREVMEPAVSLSPDATTVAVLNQMVSDAPRTLIIESLDGSARSEIALPWIAPWPEAWRPAAQPQ